MGDVMAIFLAYEAVQAQVLCLEARGSFGELQMSKTSDNDFSGFKYWQGLFSEERSDQLLLALPRLKSTSIQESQG